MSEQQENEGRFVITKPVVSTFPNLAEPQAVKRNGKATGEPKYSLNYEFDKDSDVLAAIKALAVKVAQAKWPGRDIAGDYKAGDFKMPWTSGDKLADKAKTKGKNREFSRGKIVLVTRSKFQPNLAVVQNGQITDLDGEAKALIRKFFYTGTEVLGEISLQAYDAVDETGVDGVTAYVNRALSLNRGKRLTSGASAADVFKDYIGTASDENPLDGLDDEISF